MQTPVVLFAFNRPKLFERVLERVLGADPAALIVVTDGPRPTHPGDGEQCDAVQALIDRISIHGRLYRLHSEANLGAGRRIASGLDWVFSWFQEAVILEDDLLPEPTFFPYCEELVARYRYDRRVAMISGCNFHGGRVFGEHSYFYSRCVGTWGWATWRRAWRHFDFEMRAWPALRETSMLADLWCRPEPARYWRDRFDEVAGGRADVWDYQWAFAMWSHGTFAVYPNRNMISHIGCAPDATHLVDPSDPLCNQPMQPMVFPLSHPQPGGPLVDADLREFFNIFQPRTSQVVAPRRGSGHSGGAGGEAFGSRSCC